MPNEELVRLRMMAYCLHSHVLLSSNNNIQCGMKLVRMRTRGLLTTYDGVTAVLLLMSPLRDTICNGILETKGQAPSSP
jgi:hypothetical protein